MWNGTRLVSASWISASSSRQVSLRGGQYLDGYGHQLWTYELAGLDAFAAVGYGGQHVIVIPETNMVVTFTSNNYASEDAISLPLNLLVEYIVPALDMLAIGLSTHDERNKTKIVKHANEHSNDPCRGAQKTQKRVQ